MTASSLCVIKVNDFKGPLLHSVLKTDMSSSFKSLIFQIWVLCRLCICCNSEETRNIYSIDLNNIFERRKFYQNNEQLLKILNTISIPNLWHLMTCIFYFKNLLVYVQFFAQKALFNLTKKKNLDSDLERKWIWKVKENMPLSKLKQENAPLSIIERKQI